jgi:putative selenate reductase FAD-binding subunit
MAVVDLQGLPLNTIEHQGNNLEIGATVSLQSLLDTSDLPAAMYKAIRLEANHNLLQVATLAGTLMAASGRSPLATALLAMDASLMTISRAKKTSISLGDFLPIRAELLPGRLITQIRVPANVRLAFDYVARSPADQPIVCVAVVQWTGKRTRVALGGYDKSPILALDGPDPGGVEAAARDAYCQAEDVWGSAKYRGEVAGILTRRCLSELG